MSIRKPGMNFLFALFLLSAGDLLADDIIAAAKRGDAFAVEHYLRKSAENLEARDGFRYTPLHWAAVRGNWEAFEILVEAGAPVDALGWDGGTPLHMASHHDRPDMVRLLLDRGADLAIRNQWGRTPLHVAARRNCDLVAALLLTRGADANAVTKEGWTPLHVASMAGHGALAALLLEHGVDVELEDEQGKVAADYTFERPPAVELDPSALEAYTGRYALGSHVEIKVWQEDGRLWLAEFGPNQLYPIGPDTFYCKREPWRVSFARDAEGAVERVEIAFLRRTVEAERLPQYEYVGSAVCAECHLAPESGGQYVAWMQSRHGHAYWELKTDWARFLASIRDEYRDIEHPAEEWRCLKCHVTGAQDPDALFGAAFRQEEGVGCEACHGPGSAYADREIMADRTSFLEHGGRVPDKATCRGCHERDDFHFDERLPRIAHPLPDAGGEG
jgi:hypothetical protein